MQTEMSARIHIQIKYNSNVTSAYKLRVFIGRKKSVLSAPGYNVLCLKIILASTRRLSWVFRTPAYQ